MKLFLNIAILCYSAVSFAAEPAPTQTPGTTPMERFENYPAKTIYKGKPAKINFVKNPKLREYRTALRESIREGANFAGHYRVTEVGCGTACQLIFVLDTKTGQSLAVGKNSQVGELSMACDGALYQLDSNLLIVNPPDPQYPPMCPAEQYLVIGNKMKRLK